MGTQERKDAVARNFPVSSVELDGNQATSEVREATRSRPVIRVFGTIALSIPSNNWLQSMLIPNRLWKNVTNEGKQNLEVSIELWNAYSVNYNTHKNLSSTKIWIPLFWRNGCKSIFFGPPPVRSSPAAQVCILATWHLGHVFMVVIVIISQCQCWLSSTMTES